MTREITQSLIHSILTTAAPSFDTGEAARIGLRHFGVHASARTLVSERDQNFRLDADNGRRYVLKFSNGAEHEQVVDFQNRALLHLANSDAGLPVPRVVPALDGCLHKVVRRAGQTHFTRLFTWVDGVVLDHATIGLAARLGRLLARLGLALRDFAHPGSKPPLLWDLKHAGDLRQLLPHITESALADMITLVLDRFDEQVAPRLGLLRKQVIYSDMNPDNVLVDVHDRQRISGLIDFGDLVESPLVMDLAIASAYQLAPADEPLAGALPMISGYHAVRPLEDIEQLLLGDLVKTRLAASLLIGSYRAALFPDNREYLLTSFAKARTSLLALGRCEPEAVTGTIAEACANG